MRCGVDWTRTRQVMVGAPSTKLVPWLIHEPVSSPASAEQRQQRRDCGCNPRFTGQEIRHRMVYGLSQQIEFA